MTAPEPQPLDVAAVRETHTECTQRTEDGGVVIQCRFCWEDWPCPTIRLLAERDRLAAALRFKEGENDSLAQLVCEWSDKAGELAAALVEARRRERDFVDAIRAYNANPSGEGLGWVLRGMDDDNHPAAPGTHARVVQHALWAIADAVDTHAARQASAASDVATAQEGEA